MTLLQFALVLFTQTAQVAGQLMLKRGMAGSTRRLAWVGGGVVLLTFWFLGWMRLLQQLDLSYLYPFEGISLVLLVLAARFLLQEKMDVRSWIGVGLVTTGVLLVA